MAKDGAGNEGAEAIPVPAPYASRTPGRSMGGLPGAWTVLLMMALIVLLVGATFRVGVQKNLAGTFTTEEWGRYLFGIGAALTWARFSIGGFVVDDPIEQTLQAAGVTADPAKLAALGTKFPENLRDERLMQNALERARDFAVPAPPPGDYQRLRGSVGDDVGIATYTSVAFKLFGTQVRALYYTYFALLGITVLLFFLGHGGSTAALACLALMLLALYLLVASDLVDLWRASGTMDVKDPRFFGTIAAIPALHLLLAWTRRDGPPAPMYYAAMLGQALVFAFALHVRWPLIWLLVALVGYGTFAAVRYAKLVFFAGKPRRWRPRPSLAGAVFVLTASIGVVATDMAAHPLYRLDGDLIRHPFWHHMIGSLQANPDWAKKYLPTVNGVTGDSMPAEIARQEIAKLPREERSQYLMRINYPSPEAIAGFARQRFFEILVNDPLFVLRTYVLVTPQRIASSIADFYVGLARGLTPARLTFAIIALLATAWLAAGDAAAPRLLAVLMPLALLFSLLALVPVFIATPVNPIVMVDHFLWSLFFLCLLACWGGVRLIGRWRHRSA